MNFKASQNQIDNLVDLLDGYFTERSLEGTTAVGQHINVNVIDKDMLVHAQQHPELYPQLTIRVSGYAVNFHNLTKVQQDEVISRTFHDSM